MTDTYTPPVVDDAEWVDWLVTFNDRARDFIGEFGPRPSSWCNFGCGSGPS